ncbi:META domain-containing protein [Plantibacter sp. VKM Ac-2876]|uniref:META domain-containing protein n=1 Tax=Plantibacter sp. VKM Ac-2876 TaxID=2783826 RepID=UPI00188A3841|nr:META domain-containing protein [Plantibacter sp. VKM Ac-2876]MBF4564126.1 META domain-containing protein [Plantibacter sp. VKM Ac-2876]
MFTGNGSNRGRAAALAAIGAAVLALTFSGCASGTESGVDASTTTPGTESGDAVGIVGVWGDADAQNTPSLVFAEDGKVTGTDGCNRLMGSWTADGDTVEFAPLVSTRMACEGVDTWLSGGASGTWTDTSLVVLDESGTEIGTLERSE